MKMRARTLELLRRLVEIKSPSGEEDEILGFISDYIERSGFKIVEEKYGVIVRGANENFWVVTHVDTVNTNYKFCFDGYYAYGTGVCDAKGSVAAILMALDALNEKSAPRGEKHAEECDEKSDLNMSIALLRDEEGEGTGSEEFARRSRGSDCGNSGDGRNDDLILSCGGDDECEVRGREEDGRREGNKGEREKGEKEKEREKERETERRRGRRRNKKNGNMRAVVMEPTSLRVADAHLGSLEVLLRVYGMSAHGSTPEMGVNAIEEMFRILKDLRELHPCLLQCIRGGSDLYAVPERCEARLEFRLKPSESASSLKKALIEVISSRCIVVTDGEYVKGADARGEVVCHVDILDETDGFRIEGVAREALEFAIHSTGMTVEYCEMPSWTDALNLHEFGWDVAVWGPGELWRCHTPSERISLDEIAHATRILIALNELCVQVEK